MKWLKNLFSFRYNLGTATKPRPLPAFDPEVSARLKRILEKLGSRRADTLSVEEFKDLWETK